MKSSWWNSYRNLLSNGSAFPEGLQVTWHTVLNRAWLESTWEGGASDGTHKAEQRSLPLGVRFGAPREEHWQRHAASLMGFSTGCTSVSTSSALCRPLRAKLRILSALYDSLGLTAFPNTCPWKASQGAGKLKMWNLCLLWGRDKVEARAALNKKLEKGILSSSKKCHLSVS